MRREPTLFEHWCLAAADVEWLCHVGIGRFFAPWHPPTVQEYEMFRDALHARVDTMLDAGVILPQRALVLRAAIAAHGEPYPRRATLEDLHRRDQALRAAFEPPAPLRCRVRAMVPIGPWPLPRYVPPPPVLCLPLQ